MAAIAQRYTRLNGVDYAPGDPVPDDAVNRVVQNLGLVSAVPEAAVAGLLTGTREVVEAFDPGEHTVREVIVFLDAYPAQTERVRAAEEAGRRRTTLLEVLDGEPAQTVTGDGSGEALPPFDPADPGPHEAPGTGTPREPVTKPVYPAAPPPVDPDADTPATEPPRAGPGSSRAAWLAYANSRGIGVPADADRNDIIAEVDRRNAEAI